MDRNPGPSRGNTPSRGRAGTRSRSQSASAATLSGQFMTEAQNAAFLSHILNPSPQNHGQDFHGMFPPAQSGPGGYDMFGPGHTSLSPHPPEESGFSWPSDVGRSQPNVPSSSLHPQFGLGPQNNPHPFNQSFPSNPTPYAHTHTQVELPPPTNLYQQPEGSVSAPDLDVEDAYDKRQRNTAASARFRIKKKQRTVHLERTVGELTTRTEELEKEAGDLRRENGWLKEIVLLKSQHFGPSLNFTPPIQTHQPPPPPIAGPSSSSSNSRQPDPDSDSSGDLRRTRKKGQRARGKR